MELSSHVRWKKYLILLCLQYAWCSAFVVAGGETPTSAAPTAINTTTTAQFTTTNFNWTLTRASDCKSAPQLGCRCETTFQPIRSTKITCSCGGETANQNAQVHGAAETVENVDASHQIIWVIENCRNLQVHPDVLPKGAGQEVTVIFRNISNVVLEKSAFASTGSSDSLSSPSVHFEQCAISTIPPKGFPSNLERIVFKSSQIGSISADAFKQLYIKEMLFDNSTVDDVHPNAFNQDLISWTAQNTRFKRIQTNAIHGGIRSMNWSSCIVDHLESSALKALIRNVVIQNSQFYLIDESGLFILEWSSLSLINNDFHRVMTHGVDLTQRSSDPSARAIIRGSKWHSFESDFIYTGTSSEQVESVRVENNTVMQFCECEYGNYPWRMLTEDSSQLWFLEQFINNSKCLVRDKTANECLNQTETFVEMSELQNLCASLPCFRESYKSIGDLFPPQLSKRLRILLIFIATLIGAIVVLIVLVTMCVYLMKRGDGPKTSETSDITKSSVAPHDFSDVVYKMSQQGQISLPPPTQPAPPPPSHQPTHSSFRPKSMLLDDVEMEDKGVQTMPSELSSEVLEGLRDKLMKQESFMDAKETIDRLYGLIQVNSPPSTQQQQSKLNLHPQYQSTSPPDVTIMHNNQHSQGTNTTRTLVPPPAGMIKSLTTSFINNPRSPTNVPHPQHQRYAQIQKPKTVLSAGVCEYGDPSIDFSSSPQHIYSELSAGLARNHQHHNNINSHHHPQQQSTFSRIQQRLVPAQLPVVCPDYNEPKDVQSHVYAELVSAGPAPPPLNNPPPLMMMNPMAFGHATINPNHNRADQQFHQFHHPHQDVSNCTTMPARNNNLQQQQQQPKGTTTFSSSQRPLPEPPLFV